MTDVSPRSLRCRLAATGVPLDDRAAEVLIALVGEAIEAGQNLTAIRDPHLALERHLLDSLVPCALSAIRDGDRPIVDVGSGIGFPGLALAAVFPQRAVVLVESEKRKAEWLSRAALQFPNVRVVHERSEEFSLHSRATAGLVVARALGPGPVALELCAPLVADGGRVALWRAGDDSSVCDDPAAELGFSPGEPTPYAPFPGADRYIQVHRRIAPTPDRFPRRPGRAAKRPLS